MRLNSGAKRKPRGKRRLPFLLIPRGGNKPFDEVWQEAKQDLAALIVEEMIQEEQEKQERV